MLKVDPATVEALQFTAPWVSVYDAKILRNKVSSGDIFSNFSQQQREEIWGRLQSFKDLVPSIFELFENVKCLEAWADCLKWLVQLGPRETLSSTIAKIYTGVNQPADSAMIQENETTFKLIPADSARRIDLGYRQLCAFAMRYHREIPKKPCRNDILAKPRAMLDTARLREIADLANHLGFESSEITALKQLPKSADPSRARRNARPILVTEGPGEIKKDRCGLPHVPNYEEDRKFLFITNLHHDTDEQSEGITSYFRLKSVYLKFFGKLNDFNLQRHLTMTEEAPVSHSIQSTSPVENLIRGSEPMNIDEPQTEDTVMQEGDKEGERSLVQVALAQDTMRRPKNLSIMLEKQEQEHEQYRQKLKEKANTLQEEEQNLEQKRQKLFSDANTLERQEREQEKHRLTLAREATSLREQDQEHQNQQKLLCDISVLEKQEQEYQQELTGNTNMLREQVQQQTQQRQKLLSDVSEIEKQEQKQEERRQKLLEDASVIGEQEQDQERRRQGLASSAIALREKEQEQEQMLQKFTRDANALREQEQKQEQQRQDIVGERRQLLSQEQKQEAERKTLAANACELNEEEQRQEERRQELATIANELTNQENRQKEQRETLAREASNLKDQEFRQSERKQKLMTEINKLNKQEKRHEELRRNEMKQKQKRKASGSKYDESGIFQVQDEREIGELQRQSQEELADLDFSSPFKFKDGGVHTDQSKVKQLQDKSAETGLQENVLAPTDEDIPRQERGPRLRGSQGDRLHEIETLRGNQGDRVQEGKAHESQEDRQENRAHEKRFNDHTTGEGGNTDGAREGVHEDVTQNDEWKERVSEEEVQQFQAQKRRVTSDESDEGETLRAWEGRKPMEKGKYQRLNKFGPSNSNMA